jgi:hypothetical protein
MGVASMLYFLDFRTVLVTRMRAGELGDMRIRTTGLVIGKYELDDQNSKFEVLA